MELKIKREWLAQHREDDEGHDTSAGDLMLRAAESGAVEIGEPKHLTAALGLSRTEWAEHHTEDFLSLPLVREFVFRSPQTLIGGIQKEVVDFLVAYGDTAILISQKSQEDPTFRTGADVESWVCKNTKAASSQICGALRKAKDKVVWCEHLRRGRVEFPNGLPPISHAVVIAEALERVDMQVAAAYLPLEFQGVPITYLSVNDFLNLVMELRTLPELLDYLEDRRSLSDADLRVIGDEKPLFEFYLLNGGSLNKCPTRAHAHMAVAGQQDRLSAIITAKAESDRYGFLLEDVADALSTRHPDYATSVPPAILAQFDPPDARNGYLEMQSVLADLRLRERAELGKAFHEVIEDRISGENDLIYMSAYLDSRPDWVFVFGSCKDIERPVVLKRAQALMHGAMAFYKKNCFIVIDRNGESFEVALERLVTMATPAEEQVGRQLFGHLRVHDTALTLTPTP